MLRLDLRELTKGFRWFLQMTPGLPQTIVTSGAKHLTYNQNQVFLKSKQRKLLDQNLYFCSERLDPF